MNPDSVGIGGKNPDPGVRAPLLSGALPASTRRSLEELCSLAARLMRADGAGLSLLADDGVVAAGIGSDTAGARLETPVRTQAGDEELGTLVVWSARPRAWSDAEIASLDVLAEVVTDEVARCAETARREGLQERLSIALDSAGIGSWELDLASGDFRGDARLLQMFGFAPDATETRFAAFARRVPPEDRSRVAESLEASIADGSDYAEEYRVVQPDGSVRWVAANGRPVYGAGGEFLRLVGSAYDTTEQHDAAERAAATSELLALIASASEVLASSLEAGEVSVNLARLAVPTLADWSIVSIVDDHGSLADVACWHRDPSQLDGIERFMAHRLEGRTEDSGVLRALSSRQPFVMNNDAKDLARRTLRSDAALEALEAIDLESAASFPMLTDEHEVVGLLTLARGPGRPGFTPEQLAATSDLCRRASITVKNAQSFGREREMSEQLQRSMLTDPVQPERLEVVVRYTPASKAAQVGGDWYDAFTLDSGATVLVVGDVVGHDSVAAAVMGQLRSMLRAIAATSGATPALLLADLDRALVTLEMLTNASVVVAQAETGPGPTELTLRWSNAGHPPPLLVHRAGEVVVLEDHDHLLGVAPEFPRAEHTAHLEPGSTVFLYTDGLVERRDEDIDVSIERLRERVAALPDIPLSQAVDLLMGDLLGDEPDDDVVVLAMRVTG